MTDFWCKYLPVNTRPAAIERMRRTPAAPPAPARSSPRRPSPVAGDTARQAADVTPASGGKAGKQADKRRAERAEGEPSGVPEPKGQAPRPRGAAGAVGTRQAATPALTTPATAAATQPTASRCSTCGRACTRRVRQVRRLGAQRAPAAQDIPAGSGQYPLVSGDTSGYHPIPTGITGYLLVVASNTCLRRRPRRRSQRSGRAGLRHLRLCVRHVIPP